jgi:transglutaminase-like putative cysteine protease
VALNNLPENAKTIDLWLPVAQDTDGQKVSSVKVIYPTGGNIATDPRYGNKIWHKRFEAPFTNDLREGVLGAEIVFEIHRTEIVVAKAKALEPAAKVKSPEKVYLEPNKLIPIDIAPVKKIAAELKLEWEPPIRAAHKMYEWLIEGFTYNHKAPGAGRGDVVWACDSKTGDCGDYNSTFIAVMRQQGIPADHEFGFFIPANKREGKVQYYHCWSRFQVDGAGWIPVDPSEADKHPELRKYNFGSQTANLAKFTHGRDITLVPAQAGQPLNKFIFPYAEIDGKEHKGVSWDMTFKDIKN